MLNEKEIEKFCGAVGDQLGRQLYSTIVEKLTGAAASAQRAQSEAEQAGAKAKTELAVLEGRIGELKKLVVAKEKELALAQEAVDALNRTRDELTPIVQKLRAEHQSHVERVGKLLAGKN